MSNNKRVLLLAQFAILLAIEAVFCFTPLGSLPAIGPIVATLALIPVVITALSLGIKAGTAMGAFAGLFSFIVWTFMPPLPIIAFVFSPFYVLGEFKGNFWSLVICFVPRALAGTVTGLCYRILSAKFTDKSVVSFSVSAALGSLTNTFGVLGGIWLFFGGQYESLAGQAIWIVVGLQILTSGMPEAVLAAVVAPAVCKPLKSMLMKGF